MSMIEKFKEHKKMMFAKFDEAQKNCAKAMDAASDEFFEKFKSLVKSASEEEFFKFICQSGDELDEVERMAAIAMRLEASEKRCKGKTECEKDVHENDINEGPHVMIIGL